MIALLLKEFRRVQNISQTELANSIFVSREHIAKIENGDAEITDEYLIKWCEFFEIKPEHLKNYSLVVKPNESKIAYIFRTWFRFKFLSWVEKRNKKLGRY